MLQPQSLGDPIRSSALQSHLPGAKLKGDKEKTQGPKKMHKEEILERALASQPASQPANRVIYQEITTKLKFSHLQNSSSSRSIIDMASSSTYSRTSPENGREIQPDMNLGLYLCGCVCVRVRVCLSVCLSGDLSSDQWIYPMYLQGRKKHQRQSLVVQATDKALCAGAGNGFPRSLRKCSHKQVFPCSCCNCKAQAASFQQASPFACLLVCLFVCLFSFCSLVPRCYQFFSFFFFCFFTWRNFRQ